MAKKLNAAGGGGGPIKVSSKSSQVNKDHER